MTSQDYPDPPTRPDNATMDTTTTTEDPLIPFERDAHNIPQLDAFQYRHGIVVYTGIPRVSEYTNVFMMSSNVCKSVVQAADVANNEQGSNEKEVSQGSDWQRGSSLAQRFERQGYSFHTRQ